MGNIATKITWDLADWRKTRISHKFMRSLREEYPDVSIRRLGKSKAWSIEGHRDAVDLVADRIYFEQERKSVI